MIKDKDLERIIQVAVDAAAKTFDKLKIFEVQYDDGMYVIIATSKVEAKDMFYKDRDIEENPLEDIEIIERARLTKGVIFHYDNEDFYWKD